MTKLLLLRLLSTKTDRIRLDFTNNDDGSRHVASRYYQTKIRSVLKLFLVNLINNYLIKNLTSGDVSNYQLEIQDY